MRIAFTVDCFGDILARNILETCYELFTCVLGWIFIGQVIGRINALMVTLDKARKLRNDRVEDFQQYAKQRALPDRLRLRAMKGLAIKAECQLELELPSTLRDLPGSLRALVAGEMYNAILKPLPEFAALSSPQLEVMARALNLEIYLPGDIICETNRMAHYSVSSRSSSLVLDGSSRFEQCEAAKYCSCNVAFGIASGLPAYVHKLSNPYSQ
ncbi:hypothetical protein PHYBOEH_007885 [Phytophthora boehmeriae]|uniref:Uncharacterized protein n=1 Tax=Phytophthora boehmeriae TaxID=109152 RepID=A0A8T1W6N7_9STRA|nr:hypothetical protein PHYBOEH_007885 [Phytophthora boehmeriae]